MTSTWTPDDLQRIGTAHELQIATRRADGTLRRWVPIWVVSTGGQVYVRTWYRRDTGWFGQVLTSPRARIRVPGLEADVAVEDVGESTPELRAAIDAAYLEKYGHHGGTERMVTAEAAAATLRINNLFHQNSSTGSEFFKMSYRFGTIELENSKQPSSCSPLNPWGR